MDIENSIPNLLPKATKKVTKTIEQTYTKKSQLEHILLRPDTYGKTILHKRYFNTIFYVDNHPSNFLFQTFYSLGSKSVLLILIHKQCGCWMKRRRK